MPKKKSKPAKKKRPAAKKIKKKAAPKAKSKAKVGRTAAVKSKAPQPLAPKPSLGLPGEKILGKVEDYFGKISVIALTLKEPLAVGDTIHVHGHTTDFTEEVKSMQIEHKAVKDAKKKDAVGIKVNQKCRKGDNVYLI